MTNIIRRGRPKGYVCSDETRAKISKSRTGQRHTEATKKTISKGVRGGTKTAIPLDILLSMDLSKASTFFQNRYWNVTIPKSDNFGGGVMRLHDAVMVQKLKRHLRPGEQCHHTGSVHDNFGKYDLHLCGSKAEHGAVDSMKNKRNLIKRGEHKKVADMDKMKGYINKSKRFCKKYTKQERADRRWR